MSKPSFRVYFVPHGRGEDRRVTGILVRRAIAELGAPPPPSAFGRTEDDVLADLERQLLARLATGDDRVEPYLWTETLSVRTVRADVHPLSTVKTRAVIGKKNIPLRLSYAWCAVEGGGYHVLLPRFGGWFILEDLELAPDVLRHAVSSWLLGAAPRWVYDFRTDGEEYVLPFAPPMLDKHEEDLDGESTESAFPTLDQVADELVERAARGKLPVTVGGSTELEALLRAKPRFPPASLLIVGEPGVGKTTLVRRLARALAARRRDKRADRPPRIWSTSGDRILAGMVYLGMWQDRCLRMIAELESEGDYLYVGRLAGILRGQPDGSSIAEIFEPALEADRISLIAECTPAELSHARRTHGSLVGRFTIVRVEESSRAATLELLEAYAAKKKLRRFHPSAAKRLVALLDAYHRSVAFPGKLFRFLDWLSGDVAETPEGDPEIPALPGKAPAPSTLPYMPSDVIAAYARWSGIPTDLLSDDVAAGSEVFAKRLSARVIGQDAACGACGRVLSRFKAGMSDPERPTASLLFVGPTGVGKTELAKQLARTVFGDESRLVRIDMSEYMTWGSATRLLDVTPGTRSLARMVAEQPLSVVLLDEIEKAHPEVFDVLLGVLGEGRLTDTSGRLVDFRGTIVVMTSNLGVSATRPVGFGGATSGDSDFVRAVREHFRPELFNRIDYVLPFRALTPEDVRRIADLELAAIATRPGFADRAIRLVVSAAARDLLAAEGYHPTHGARPLRRLLEERVVTPLAARLAAEPALRDRVAHVGLPDEPPPEGALSIVLR